jgi:hypothetical protein
MLLLKSMELFKLDFFKMDGRQVKIRWMADRSRPERETKVNMLILNKRERKIKRGGEKERERERGRERERERERKERRLFGGWQKGQGLKEKQRLKCYF